ncbi:hypothetical protein DOTSEDRAFT_26773 [Dothistroma septosporum NZE10]|uniref:Uncharacterized protein n=1 Tax=Dothistroma septosporum (strain NZE10 / CBS 128990) TaxID=675120 RepID=N1PHL7_DOTSN|nr:hypothetical protein DOTSEDRAFT_26773 [Dothistroma septosporum NZE10]
MGRSYRILWIGIGTQDPEFPLPPGADPNKLAMQLYVQKERLDKADYQTNLFLPPMRQGIEMLEQELKANQYDAVMIGVGLRTAPPLLEYFERIVNTARTLQPELPVCFNGTIETTLEAAQRILPP